MGPHAPSCRTAAAGEVRHLDVGALLASSELPASLRVPRPTTGPIVLAAVAPPPAPPDPCTPGRIADIACFLLKAVASPSPSRAGRARLRERLAELGAEPDPGERARQAIAALGARMWGLGWLRPFHGIARCIPVGTAPAAFATPDLTFPWLPSGDEQRVLRLAWCACAISFLSPPLILWTRPAALTWWRSDTLISLRWLGRRPSGGHP